MLGSTSDDQSKSAMSGYFAQSFEPHAERRRRALALHPELRALFGRDPRTGIFMLLVAAAQTGLCFACAHVSWWATIVLAWVVGAFLAHGAFVLVHDCAHGLVYRSQAANNVFAILANFAFFVPAGVSYRKYHLAHHRHLGERGIDADVPLVLEAKAAGKNPVGKALWLFFYLFWQAVRIPALGKLRFWDGWTIANAVVQASFLVALGAAAGPKALVYLFVSSFAAVGLHPLGGRWIQEHFVARAGQETYSYYGPLNALTFNVGYHVEHHDFPAIPWSRLPRVRALAPELYEPLHSHRSWSALLWRFVAKDLSLYSRFERLPAETAVVDDPEAELRRALEPGVIAG